MKRVILIVFLFLFGLQANAQVTPDPKIDRKSSQDVFINKLEITEQYTILHMQYYDRSDSELDEFFKRNPSILKRLEDMGLSRREAERLYNQQFSVQQTISFQPSSKIVLSDGKSYRFIKAVNIPVSPERLPVERGKKYFFKAYFEKIPPGYEKIDMIEHHVDYEGDTNYWNFKGIHINNPLNRVPAQESPVQEEVLTAKDFRLYGKIYNAATEETINAKIVCKDTQTGEVIDSLQTARTGRYEFLIDTENVNYTVSAEGFEDLTEFLDLKFFLKQGQFEKDIYLDPAEQVEPEEDTSIGEQLDETATSFKLDKVYFNLGDARILEASHAQLDNLVKYLKDNPELKILIEGHTDNQGDQMLNQRLSLDRAYNVRNYLVEKGIDTKRIQFKGHGSSIPVAPNDTEENRSKNRRVEYKFVD